MYIDTRVARFDSAPGDPYRPTSTPIYQTATFEQESALEFGQYDYSRSGNPTRRVLEERLASLERGRFGFAFASGVAAISNLLRASLLPASETESRPHLIVGADLYGGTTRLIERLLAPLGVRVLSVDTRDLEALKTALQSVGSGPGMVLLESPSNPLLHVSDIAAVAELTKRAGVKLAVDNTALSPYWQNPLELGADVVVHSATKHLGGHGDVTAGAIVTNDAELAEAIGFLQNAEGSALAPFDSWLLLRGIKTLGVRVAQESRNAQVLAEFLEGCPFVKQVHYPGLSSHPGHGLQAQQARGFGQLISFETGDQTLSQRLCQETQLFSIAVSFGNTNSTITFPCHMSHASVPQAAITSGRVAALPRDLVRISVGLEDPRDLIEDLQRVFEHKHQASSRPLATRVQ